MADADARAADCRQRTAEPLRDRDRAVATTRTSGGDGEVALPFRHIVRDDVLEIVLELLNEFTRRRVPFHESGDSPVTARAAAKRRNEVRIRQASHVEDEIRVDRDAVLVAETEKRH